MVAQTVKNQPAVQETRVPSPGQEGPLEKGMATYSSVLAWRIPRTEEPGGLQSMALQRVGHDWSNLAHTHACRCLQSLRVSLCPVAGEDVCPGARPATSSPRSQPVSELSPQARPLQKPSPSGAGLGPPEGPLPAVGDGGWDAVEAPRSWLTWDSTDLQALVPKWILSDTGFFLTRRQ